MTPEDAAALYEIGLAKGRRQKQKQIHEAWQTAHDATERNEKLRARVSELEAESVQLRARLSAQVDGPYSVVGRLEAEVARLSAENVRLQGMVDSARIGGMTTDEDRHFAEVGRLVDAMPHDCRLHRWQQKPGGGFQVYIGTQGFLGYDDPAEALKAACVEPDPSPVHAVNVGALRQSAAAEDGT